MDQWQLKERSIQAAIQLACSRKGVRLFRNSTGVGFIGRIVERVGTRVTLANARVIHAGLCKGGSDLVGWSPMVITSDMVGQTVAVFTAVEIKTPGVVTSDDQRHFIQVVRRAGGRAGVAMSSGEAETICAESVGQKTETRLRRIRTNRVSRRMSHEDTTEQI